MGIHESKSESKLQHRAVFLDRDGVINRALERENKPYPPRIWPNLKSFPSSRSLRETEGRRLSARCGDEPAGRGPRHAEAGNRRNHPRPNAPQLPLDRVEVCYHPGQGSDCDCRKPKPGMLLRAANELGIDLKQSWMVGDRWRNVDCGHAAGCRTIFIDCGYAEELKQKPDFSARNLAEAADIILRETRNI